VNSDTLLHRLLTATETEVVEEEEIPLRLDLVRTEMIKIRRMRTMMD
jgi:hypothetical protein